MQRLRLLVRTLHLWLGLAVGGLFALLGLTGSALVFYEAIDGALHPQIAVTADGAPPSWDSPVWDQALHTVRTRWPDRTGAWRFEATGTPGAIPARYQPPGAGHHGRRVMVWLTPDGRQVLREADWGRYLMTWLYDLHMELLAGAAGRNVVGGSGLAMLVLLLSGLWAWWPRGSWRKALHLKPDAVRSRRLRDIHKLAGLIALPLLLMLTGTGVMLALPEPSNAVLAATLGTVAKTPAARSTARTGPPITMAQALAVAAQALPQGRLAWVEAPGRPDGVFMVRVQQPDDPSFRFPHSYVFVDQYSGAIVARQDRSRFGTSNRINNWLHPLHDASIGGPVLRLLALIAGLIPAVLFVTGWMRWRLLRQSRAPLACGTDESHSSQRHLKDRSKGDRGPMNRETPPTRPRT